MDLAGAVARTLTRRVMCRWAKPSTPSQSLEADAGMDVVIEGGKATEDFIRGSKPINRS